MSNQWNYDDTSDGGPSHWDRFCQVGQRQSPINIQVPEHIVNSTTCCRLSKHLDAKLRFDHNKSNHQNRLEFDDLDNEYVRKTQHHSTNIHSPRSPGSSGHSSGNSPSPEAQSNSNWLQKQLSSEQNNNNHLRVHPQHQQQLHNDNDSENENENEENIRNYDSNDKKNQYKNRSQIEKQNTNFCVTKRKVFLGYPRYLDRAELVNNGHAWQVNIPAPLNMHTALSGPPFGDKLYRLHQFHCHWGSDCSKGSEHTINGQSYAAEIHFVHWDSSRFNSFDDASKHPSGLVVLAVMIQALDGEQNSNRHLERLVHQLKRVRAPNSSAVVPLGLDMKRLFPVNRWQYATYEGSLTTPPLSETVHWLVFLSPIICSKSQIDKFRRLECSDAKQLTANCRPVQALNGRQISIWSHH